MDWGSRPNCHHIYVSTYCVHDLHLQCRLTCKICGDMCKCDCHLFVAAEEVA